MTEGMFRGRWHERVSLGEAVVITAFVFALMYVAMLPAMEKARERSRQSTCLHNLKQMGLALRLYAGDHGGWFPTDAADSTLGSFALLTNRYQMSLKSWVCPSDRKIVIASLGQPITSRNVSYAYGGLGLTENVQGNTPLACDRSTGDIRSPTPWSVPGSAHKGEKGNVIYADGHVAFVRRMNPPMYRGKNP